MSRLTTILILSFMFLFAAGAVIYAQATDTPGGTVNNPGAWMHGSYYMGNQFDTMLDVCLSNSDLTPEQRDQLRQQMQDYMQSGDWQDHMGGYGPTSNGWEDMQQRMEEHMGWSWQDNNTQSGGQTNNNQAGQTGAETGTQNGNTTTGQVTGQGTAQSGTQSGQTGSQTVNSGSSYGPGSGGYGGYGSGMMGSASVATGSSGPGSGRGMMR
jgi:hypothetical protein